MSFIDKAKDKAEELLGTAKEKTGEVTDDKSLQAEGKKDQASGKAKGLGEDIKDTFK